MFRKISLAAAMVFMAVLVGCGKKLSAKEQAKIDATLIESVESVDLAGKYTAWHDASESFCVIRQSGNSVFLKEYGSVTEYQRYKGKIKHKKELQEEYESRVDFEELERNGFYKVKGSDDDDGYVCFVKNGDSITMYILGFIEMYNDYGIDAVYMHPFAPLEREIKVTNPNRMHGDDVERIQNHLLFLGYSEVGEADGYYGPKSASAVKRFQQDNSLEQTGVVDAATYDKLFE